MLATALALARHNLAVFPLVPRGKTPAVVGGFKSATTNAVTITAWWQRLPDCNIGLATGAPSGIFVLDIDGLDGEAALRKLELAHGLLPDSVETITPGHGDGRGRHIWFRHPGGTIPNSAGRVAPHVDVRGDGGYVVTPPSVHPSGHRYAWSVETASAFADAPAWLLDLIAPRRANGSGPTPATDWQDLIKGVGEGARDCSLAKLSGYLLRRRVDPFITHELIRSFNTTRCEPPLPDRDVERIVNSIAGRELRRRGRG
jgi:hypothetical protein